MIEIVVHNIRHEFKHSHSITNTFLTYLFYQNVYFLPIILQIWNGP